VKTAAERPAAATRERIVRATSRLMQRQGYDGTGIKQIAAEASATLGSVYHFFPDGKRQLAVAAIRLGDEEFAEELGAALAREDDPAAAVTAVAEAVAAGLRESDWLDGCPVSTTAMGTAGRLPDVQEAAAQAFARWRGLVQTRLRETGVADDDARDLAHTVIAALEGAELAAQVARSEEPLRVAGRHLARLISSYR
jgi:AcrR family transcriptional regulator